MPPAVRTARLHLRPIEEGDAGLLFELDSDPEVMRYLSGGPPTPLEQITGEILPRCLSYPARAPWAGVWMAFAGVFVGWFSLRPPDDLALGPELGYRLRRATWGQGLATEGATALLAHAFAHDEVPRVTATTYEFNAASRRVLEKLRMRHIRSFRLEEEDTPPATYTGSEEVWDGDEVEYAITREEWLARG